LILTIVIPTYNRNELLLASVQRLIPQLVEGVELWILDNASSTPVVQTLSIIDGIESHPNIHLHRNVTNIGGCANILRSFEVANGAWLWILGDDDVITTTAVKDILDTVKANSEVAFFNFATSTMISSGLRRESFTTQGQAGFARQLDAVGNVNFMSVGVWQVKKVVHNLRIAYHYAYSMSPSFVLLLSSLGNGLLCHFSNKVLVIEVTTAETANRWRFRDFVLGWNTILELPMSDETRRDLSLKMLSWHSPENVCVYMLAEAAELRGNGHDFMLAARRLGPYVGAFARLRFWCYRSLFIFPRFSWTIVEKVVRITVAMKLKGIDVEDIKGRSKSISDGRN